MAGSLAEYDALEDCTRNIFGRVMWSHKIQEKQADIYLFIEKKVDNMQYCAFFDCVRRTRSSVIY